MLSGCIICHNDRVVKCFGLSCCKCCKILVSCRPADHELFKYIDQVYNLNGFGLTVHQNLYRFWYDREGRQKNVEKFENKHRKTSSLVDICADVMIRDNQTMVIASTAIPDCAPVWCNLLRAWFRWKRVRGRKPKVASMTRLMKLLNI